MSLSCHIIPHERWTGFLWIADDISKWCSFEYLCWRLYLMRKPLLFKRVRYSKKLSEKCSVAQKSVMFMNDFDNFNEKCRRWKRFYWIQGCNQLFISGGQFSWTFIRWRHRAYSTVVQLFRKQSQICSFRNISENENLLVLIRPVTRGQSPH